MRGEGHFLSHLGVEAEELYKPECCVVKILTEQLLAYSEMFLLHLVNTLIVILS